MKYTYTFIYFLILFVSCAPKPFLIERPKLLSIYFDRKINQLEKSKNRSIDHQRELIRTKVEYGFGIVMEQADRLIDEEYDIALDKYQKANHWETPPQWWKIYLRIKEEALAQ